VIRYFAVFWLALAALAAPVSAQTFPKLTGRVVDEAHILSPAQIIDLTSKSETLQAKTGRQFVVATVPDLQGYPIEDYGYKLGRTWRIGQKGEDNGVILLVAPNERKVRIEVGYGATAYVTDAMSSVIIRNSILPHFRQNPPDYGGGISAGADQIITTMELPEAEAVKRAQEIGAKEAKRLEVDVNPIPVIFIVIIIVIVRSLAAVDRGEFEVFVLHEPHATAVRLVPDVIGFQQRGLFDLQAIVEPPGGYSHRKSRSLVLGTIERDVGRNFLVVARSRDESIFGHHNAG